MSKKPTKIETGSLLIAEPYMLDLNFRRGVVLICNHEPDGILGFVLNKPIEMNITDLIATFPTFESEVYYGGPLQTDTIHYLHTKGDLLDNSVPVLPGIYWGGDFEQLKIAIESGEVQSSDIRFYVGFAGWDEGQLEEEQRYASWMVVPGQQQHILSKDWKTLWKTVLEGGKDTYEVIGQMDVPNFN